jgi:hypothetical protein
LAVNEFGAGGLLLNSMNGTSENSDGP